MVWVGVVWAWSTVTSQQYSLVHVKGNTKRGIVRVSINAHINVFGSDTFLISHVVSTQRVQYYFTHLVNFFKINKMVIRPIRLFQINR